MWEMGKVMMMHSDAVVDEVSKWEALPQTVINAHSKDGMLDEFSLLSSLKSQFPLHYIIFKQTACHMGHEGDCEQFFSTAKHRSDPNMKQSFLRHLAKTAKNKHMYNPSAKDVWRKYKSFFSTCDTHPSDGESESELGSNESDSSE